MRPPGRIGLLVGTDQQTRQDWYPGMELQNHGSTDVYRLVGLPDAETRVLQFTKGYLRQKAHHIFSGYDLFINLVTDADQNGAVLEVLSRVLKGLRVPVLNSPDKVRATTRDAVAKRLAGIDDLVVPRTRRVQAVTPAVLRGIEKSGLTFPAILRESGTHSGRMIGLLPSPDECPPTARAKRGYHLTEFVDFKSEDGLYRKYRVFVFGGRPVFRHMIISDGWNVHAADRERFMMARPALVDESQSLYARGFESLPATVQKVLRRIEERMELDFYGVDFGVLPDGRVVLFEANATMNFFPISADPRLVAMQACVPPARAAFAQMLADAMASAEVRTKRLPA